VDDGTSMSQAAMLLMVDWLVARDQSAVQDED
jgi:hypothetical protein